MTQHDHSNLGHGSGATAAAIQSGGFLGLGLAGHTEVFGQVGFIGFLRAFADADKVFFADLNELNNSDAEGSALLFQNGDRLTVITAATGVEAGQIHAQHIHGFEDGRNAFSPTLAQDDDRDGFIEVAEGAETYGPILLDLTSPAGAGAAGFPKPAGNSFLFAESYNLNDPANGALATLLDEAPLQNREIVLHGLSTLEGQGAGTPGEIDGSAGFKLFLPIASGEIQLASSSGAALAAFVDSLDAFESEHAHAPDPVVVADEDGTDMGHDGTDHGAEDDDAPAMADSDEHVDEDEHDGEPVMVGADEHEDDEGGHDETEHASTDDHGGMDGGTGGSTDGGSAGTGGVDTFGTLTFAGFIRAFTQADDYYFADLNELNNSDAEGGALLLLNGTQLTVITAASGVEAGQTHAQHIHGFVDGSDTRVPTLAQDDDRDGFIELAEGLDTYGPVLLNLTAPPGAGAPGFPTPTGNSFLFAQTYDLSNPVNGAFATLLDEAPLENREIVLHGMTTLEGHGRGTMGEVDGTGGYKGVLPIAAGEIQKASAGDALAGFLGSLDDFDAVTQAQINDLMLG